MNSTEAFVRSGSFEVTLRPARAVYLVDATPGADRTGVRRAIQEASTRWGGACEPIVLVAEDGTVDDSARQVIELSRADGAVNVNLPDERAVAVADALGLALVPLKAIDNYGITIGTCHPGALGEWRTVDGYGNGFVIACRDGKLWEAAGAGDLTVEHEKTLSPQLLAVRRPAVGNDEVGRAQVWPHHTLAARTLFEFGQNYASPVPVPRPTVLWVTRGDDIRDCVEFWNLRAIRSVSFGPTPMYLLPEDEVDYWVGFDKQLHAALKRPNDFEPDVVLVSRSVSEDALVAFADKLGLVASQKEPRLGSAPADEPPVRTSPYTYTIKTDLLPWFAFERKYGHKTQVISPVYGEQTSLEFPSPIPFTGAGWVLLEVGGPALAALPRRAPVARLCHPDGIWRDNGIQITTHAVNSYRLPLAVPTLAAATRALLDEGTAQWALSDKGAIGAGLLADSDVSALMEPDVFEMLLTLTTPRTERMAAELAEALGRGINDLSGLERELAERWSGRSDRQFRSARAVDLPGVKQPARLAALEHLAQIGWSERGLQLTCPACRLTSFLPLSEQQSRGPGRCPGCGTSATYTRTTGSTEVAYRLDSRIDRAADQGVLSHLLTIAALRCRFAQVHLLPGVDVWFTGETEKKEVDLYGICDAKVATGEVKQTAAAFTDTQVRDDVAKTARLGADIHLMASPGEIPTDACSLAEELCAEHGLELVILQKPDLRPATVTPQT